MNNSKNSTPSVLLTYITKINTDILTLSGDIDIFVAPKNKQVIKQKNKVLEQRIYQHFKYINDTLLAKNELAQAALKAFNQWVRTKNNLIYLLQQGQQTNLLLIAKKVSDQQLLKTQKIITKLSAFIHNQSINILYKNKVMPSKLLYELKMFFSLFLFISIIFIYYLQQSFKSKLKISKNYLIENTKKFEQAKEKLKQLSETDELTQIANRRGYENVLCKQVSLANRSNNPLSLMMIDIDYFKKYNDFYGHGAGDVALKKVAKAIDDKLVRDTDLVARYGGEEFVVLLPSTDAQGALKVAQAIKNKVESLDIKHRKSKVAKAITVSIGIATLKGSNCNAMDLFTNADRCLYQAKHEGRNQCSSLYSKISHKELLLK